MLDHGNEPVGWKDKAPRSSHRHGRLNVERTIHGRPHGNAANTTRRLRLVQVDHHFVPTRAGSDNDLQIVYSIKGLSGDTVKLRVTCDQHDPKLIFERDLTDEEKQDGRKKLIKWNGMTSCTSGKLHGKIVNPTAGKLKVSLNHSEIKSKELETCVLYREIKLAKAEWKEIYLAITGLASDAFPAGGPLNHQKLWFQYTLNELGYLAGPLKDTIDANQILRAFFRYTQSHPSLAKIIDFTTLQVPAGNCGWGWRSEWERIFGTLDNLCSGGTTSAGRDLINRLTNKERPRTDVVESPAVLTDRSKNSRIIIDHDLYYINKDFLTANANADYDAEFLNRFSWPIKAKVFLVARDDVDASGPGVDSPDAVGENIEASWIAFDPPENIEMVPTAPQSQVRLKTRAREFIDETHKKLAAQYGDPFVAFDNCPQSLGGARPDDPSDMAPFFEAVRSEGPLAGYIAGQFIGSYIGGDNYIIQLRLTLDGLPNADKLKQDHLKLRGLAGSFGDPGPDSPEEPLVAQTGMLTNWRRHHVLREIRWDTLAYPEINWFPIIDNFRAAHIILVPPLDAPAHVGDLFSPAVCKSLVQCMAQDPNAEEPNKTEFHNRGAEVAFNRAGMYPVPLYNLTDYEASPMNKSGVPPTPHERLRNYMQLYLKSVNSRWPSYDRAVPLARELRKSLIALQSPPGLVVMRANYIPDPDFARILPADVFAATTEQHDEIKLDRGIAVGMDYGIVLLDRVNTGRYAEAYFVTHEISHCLFGSHAFEVMSKEDHDQNDRNCIMYYNDSEKGNGGMAFGWGVKSIPDTYKMRLAVEYDAAHKEFGTLSGSWVSGSRRLVKNPPNLDVEYRVFEFTGTLLEVRKAFVETVFTPHKWVDANKNIRLVLEEPVQSPVLSVKYPYTMIIKGNAGKTKPLANIQVNPMDIKAAEPRFCGKCLLKLRGWRVGKATAAGAHAAPAVVPERSRAMPINGRMSFDGYKITEGDIKLKINGGERTIHFGMKAKDPVTGRLMGPFRFLHSHTFRWESSNGNMADLDGLTREVVLYDNPTQTGAFNSYADPDQRFAQSGGPGKDGSGSDMHSIRLPALICGRNSDGSPVAGIIRAKQSYQYCTVPKVYSKNSNDWVDIPQSQFILEKEVYLKGKEWIMAFRKSNDPDLNPIPFHFEIHYRIGRELSFKPDLVPNPAAGCTQAVPHYHAPSGSVEQEFWASGSHLLDVNLRGLTSRETSLSELKKAGFAVDGTHG